MGNSQSLLKYNYDDLNCLIGNCDEFINCETHKWKRHVSPYNVIYWMHSDKELPLNKTLRIGIMANQWPVKENEIPNLIIGHHYYYVCQHYHKYYYDVEDQKWIEENPTKIFDDLIENWDELISSAKNTGHQNNNYKYIPYVW